MKSPRDGSCVPPTLSCTQQASSWIAFDGPGPSEQLRDVHVDDEASLHYYTCVDECDYLAVIFPFLRYAHC